MNMGGERKQLASDQFDAIAQFMLSPQVNIPQDQLNMAAKLLVDTLGVTAGASRLEVSKIVRNHAVRFLGAGDPQAQARILFDGRVASQAGAAFAAASQTDNLDAHDGYAPVKGHIGCAIVPALFSLAEQLPQLTGYEALQAMVLSYEVAARAGLALHATVADYHTSGAWNSLAVAALGCRLHHCSSEQLRHALGIAEYHGPRSQMMREIDNPTMLHDGSGMGAMIGLKATMLAMDGFTGAPAVTVESREVAEFWRDLGSHWTIGENYIKPYPICRWAHAAIDAVRAIDQRHKLDPHQIESIHINTFHEASRLFSGVPKTNSQAQYSLAFAVAVQLLYGGIGPQHLEGDTLSDPTIHRLIAATTVAESDTHNARFPQGRWSDAVIRLVDGTELQSGDTAARGGLEVPMSDTEFEAKFHTMTGAVLGKDQATAIFDAGVQLLSDGDRLFSDFAERCYTVE